MFWSAEKDAAFEDLLDEVTSWRRQREEVVFEVLDRLNQALRLDPDVPGAAEVRALLLHERAEAAHAAQDTTLERYFRAQVTAMDPGGEFTAPHRARASLTFTSTPPGATVFIHRMEEQRTFLGAGDRRHVPVPFGPAGRVTHPLVETGAWALRVVAPAQGLAEGDLITQVDGVPVRSLPSDAWRRIGREGAAAVTTWTAGVLRTQAVAPGLRLRPTAAPRVRVPAAAWGVTPRAAVELPVGVYVAVLVLAGHEDTRLLVHVQDGVHRTYDVALRPSGTTPEGFVCVESDGPVRRSRFWIQERPVSRADYLSFLGSGTAGERWTQAQTQGEAAPFTWREGRLVWRAGVDPAVPITNLSWQAAQAYARWRGARDGRAYRLPTLEDWWRAAGTPGWRWPFGNQFRHKWVRTTLTDPGPPRFVHPFDQPIDASSRDVYSVTGNVSEWLDQDWGDPRADRKQYTGGSAVNADPKVFRTGGGNGQRTDVPLAWVGCRLVFDG